MSEPSTSNGDASSQPPVADSDEQAPLDWAPVSPFTRFVRRVVAGLLYVLPILITVWLIYQIYRLLHASLVEPIAYWIVPEGIENPYWTAIERWVTPPLTLLAVILFLYVMGYLFQTRFDRWTDWLFGRIPGVSTLYEAISDVIDAVQGPRGLKKIDTVVLVPFPHARSRMVGYLMGETTDATTGDRLLCVYVPLGLFPPSGYTMVFPAEDVVVTDWESASPWKVLLSGGLTLPNPVPYTNPPKP